MTPKGCDPFFIIFIESDSLITKVHTKYKSSVQLQDLIFFLHAVTYNTKSYNTTVG